MNTYTTSVTSKGQITLPAAIRKQLRLKPGKKVMVELREGRIYITAPPDADEVREKLREYMRSHHPAPVTQEEIDNVKKQDLARKYQIGES